MRPGRQVHGFMYDFHDINEDVYCEEFREELLDDDEMSNEEAGFMQGYQEAS
ncbi:hypothetical protein HYW21_08960 [Candidatus Woesearchaeota archaeon]|nr:hypothetical protein [Candidatus Woesearchaeota archaeon]